MCQYYLNHFYALYKVFSFLSLVQGTCSNECLNELCKLAFTPKSYNKRESCYFRLPAIFNIILSKKLSGCCGPVAWSCMIQTYFVEACLMHSWNIHLNKQQQDHMNANLSLILDSSDPSVHSTVLAILVVQATVGFLIVSYGWRLVGHSAELSQPARNNHSC